MSEASRDIVDQTMCVRIIMSNFLIKEVVCEKKGVDDNERIRRQERN